MFLRDDADQYTGTDTGGIADLIRENRHPA
jgi:hypothetical protein